MRLLSSEKIKDEKDKTEAERLERITKLHDEESSSVKRLNAALEYEKKERARIDDELMLARNAAEAEVRTSVLLQEIHALEERKAKALEPVTALRKEAEKLLTEAKESKAKTEAAQEKAERLTVELEDKIDSLADREEAISDKEKDLTNREAGVQSAEEYIKQSTENLSKSWVEYHREVKGKTADLERREDRVALDAKENETIRIALEKKEAELMLPIEPLKMEFEKGIQENKMKSIALGTQQENLLEKEAYLETEKSNLHDRERDIKEREERVRDKEFYVDSREAALTEHELLAGEDIKLRQKDIEEKESDIKIRERKVGFYEESNERYALRLSELQNEAKKAATAVALRENEIVKKENRMSIQEEDIAGRLQFLQSTEKDIGEKKKDLDAREKGVIETEQRSAKMARQIRTEREALDAYEASTTADIERKKREVDDARKTNELYAESLAQRDKDQDERDRLIADRRATLESAWNEFNKKQSH